MDNRQKFLYHAMTELWGRRRRGTARGRRTRGKRRRRAQGKTGAQAKGVRRSEERVAKRAGRLPRKAAMAHGMPVP